jgi:hypothetical protein
MNLTLPTPPCHWSPTKSLPWAVYSTSGLDFAFLSGSVVGLPLDHPELSPVGATNDIDFVLEVVS